MWGGRGSTYLLLTGQRQHPSDDLQPLCIAQEFSDLHSLLWMRVCVCACAGQRCRVAYPIMLHLVSLNQGQSCEPGAWRFGQNSSWDLHTGVRDLCGRTLLLCGWMLGPAPPHWDQRCAQKLPASAWVLRIQTRISILKQHTLSPWCNLPSPCYRF